MPRRSIPPEFRGEGARSQTRARLVAHARPGTGDRPRSRSSKRDLHSVARRPSLAHRDARRLLCRERVRRCLRRHDPRPAQYQRARRRNFRRPARRGLDPPICDARSSRTTRSGACARQFAGRNRAFPAQPADIACRPASRCRPSRRGRGG